MRRSASRPDPAARASRWSLRRARCGCCPAALGLCGAAPLLLASRCSPRRRDCVRAPARRRSRSRASCRRPSASATAATGAYACTSRWPRALRVDAARRAARGRRWRARAAGPAPARARRSSGATLACRRRRGEASRSRSWGARAACTRSAPWRCASTGRSASSRARCASRSTTSVTVAPSIAGVRRFRLLALQHRLRDAGVRALRRRGEGHGFAGAARVRARATTRGTSTGRPRRAAAS